MAKEEFTIFIDNQDMEERCGEQFYQEYLEKKNKELKEKVEYLKSKMKNKDKWCQLIADIGFDYDGYNQVVSLKSLIDELVKYALYSRDDYDYDEWLKGGNK